MTKHFILLITALFCFTSFTSNSQSIWTKSSISSFRDADVEDKLILPEHYIAYKLSIDALKSKLESAPSEEDKKDGLAGIQIELPLPDGSFETFEMYDSPVFASKLAAKYPSIKSYKGSSIKNPSSNVRFDLGPYGFHAAIHTPSKVYYIDPYSKITTDEYLIYDVQDQMSQIDLPGPVCGVEDDVKALHHHNTSQKRSAVPIALHVYRFALACTGEWGQIRGTAENALADMNTGINRINQIYENELAIRLVLIDENEQLLNFDPQTDPYLQVSSGSAMLNANTNIVNLRVGQDAYDIGHVYHTSCDVGGVAALGSMCNNSTKAAAVTCHYSSNLNFMAASVTSHEIGHQMTAQHTFNNCNGNESPGNAFEPGSGSTIMSYGGLCGGSLNVVSNGQGGNYYHVASLIQIYNHTRGDGLAGDNCAEQVETSNLEPTATILHEDGFYIPENTYFYLEGEGQDDNDEDELTYSWEQMNRGPSSPLGAPVGDAPHFRSLPPSPSPVRFFPSPDNIIFGNFDRTEVLFKGDKTVNFMFTVRDNNAEAGTAVWEPLEFNVVETPVKFEVTSQTSTEVFSVGDEIDVTWNVASTDLAPINTERVDILLFTGDQSNFSWDNMTMLAENVFNSGSCKVIVPNELSNQARIIVKASESVYFSISKANCRIVENTDPQLLVNATPLAQINCLPTEFIYDLEAEAYQNIDGNISYTILDGLPEGATATFEPETVQAGEASTLTISPVNDFMGGDYEVRIGAITESMDTFSRLLYIKIRSNDHRTIDAITPAANATGMGITPDYSWEGSINAESYTFELSESPNFGDNNLITTTGLTDLEYKPEVFLEKNTVYYWRVTAVNYCGEDPSAKTFAFSTESLFCAEVEPAEDVLPINISGSGKPTIQAPVEVTINGNVADVNVKRWFGEHGNNKDMRVSLFSPDGKEVVLVSNKCEQQDFNCGFDDSSDIGVKCPLNNGKVYAPQEELAAFNGDPLQGTWILQIDDQQSGNGGRLEGLVIEFCSNQVLDNPYLVRNEKVFMAWGGSRIVNSDLLEVDDDNNSKEELIYTIVDLPNKGQLSYEGNPVNVGDQFTQQDVDEDKLTYDAIAEDYLTYFSFTVIDGEGGFIGVTNFEIDVNELTSTNEVVQDENINIYPNPARDLITIDQTKSKNNYQFVEIRDLQGQLIVKDNFSTRKKMNIDVSVLPTGLYFITMKADNMITARKIIIE